MVYVGARTRTWWWRPLFDTIKGYHRAVVASTIHLEKATFRFGASELSSRPQTMTITLTPCVEIRSGCSVSKTCVTWSQNRFLNLSRTTSSLGFSPREDSGDEATYKNFENRYNLKKNRRGVILRVLEIMLIWRMNSLIVHCTRKGVGV